MTSTDTTSSACANCGVLLIGPICHECGQKQLPDRWTTKVLARQFVAQITNIEKGFLFTAQALFVAPGQFIRDYWNRKTIPAYNPFRYVLILLAINILINFWLGIDELLQESLTPDSVESQFGAERLAAADESFDRWLNALVLLILPVHALLTHWLFKRHGQNYAEHLIMNAFIMGEQALITSFTHFLFYFIPSLFPVYLLFNFAIGLGYNTYVYQDVFTETVWKCLGKAFVVGIIGILVFFGIVAGASVVALGVSG